MKNYIQVAIQACREAGTLICRNIDSAKVVARKTSAIDIVTDADLAAQKLIIGIIKKNFPRHEILAEEGIEADLSSEYIWAIDPIDGTIAFSKGLPTYSVSIALLENEKPIVGVIYLALTNEIVWTQLGEGTFIGERKLTIQNVSNLRQSSVGFDPSYSNRETEFHRIASPLSDKVSIMPILHSQATALALVAKGILNGYIQCGSPKVWDVAAGKLIVEEAGGIMTDFQGKPVDIFHLNGYIASSRKLHRQLLTFTSRTY